MSTKMDGYIMALEDSLVQAKRLEFFFKNNKLDYKIFSTAEKALEQLEKDKPSLIISDILMPGMDGYQFCHTVKSNKAHQSIPVILLTALQDSSDIIRGLQAGADNFITKPYDDQYLLSRIEHLASNINTTPQEAETTNNRPITLKYRGETFSINSGRKQILDLLISVYDTAVQRNEELIEIKDTLEKTNKELTTANEDLDAFARTVSHDLKSPLSVIIGFTSAILDNPESSVSEEEREYISYIKSSANEMNQLIKDLLSFSQSARINLEKKEINLSDIIRDMQENILMRFPDTKPKIEIKDKMPATADETMIRVVIDNLLSNAVKYSSKTKNPVIEIGTREYYGKKVYYVKDNGTGFDTSSAEKLFQPFVRLHSESEYQGTGVGLSTVKRIIEKHGGEIWAESEPGKGSTFFFSLN
jgi:signal transduction histidine kinase